MKYTKTVNKNLKMLTACVLCSTLALAPLFANFGYGKAGSAATKEAAAASIKKIDGVDTGLEKYFDSSVVTDASGSAVGNKDISVIVTLGTDSLLDSYNSRSGADASQSVADYSLSPSGRRAQLEIQSQIASLKSSFASADFDYAFGENYNVLFSGFEVTLKAKNFSRLTKLVGNRATLSIGDVYEKCETQVIENVVDIDETTGIFNSKGSKYDGSGTVIAVLDTGLDYTHSAFDVGRFTGDEVLTLDSVSQNLSDFTAAKYTAGLTANDVYINAKVPYAYDYADKDPDVYPLESEHGTHVAGVMVGNDDKIRGVAPNAQLVAMKVFSDNDEGAKDSYVISALEDCVLLGVDVINMSLGVSCGFTREQDKKLMQDVYDEIKKTGISLVAAASNSYGSSQGSEKNGSLGLTSNPDTSTVGAPSTYEAALSVASVSGTKTPYLTYGDTVMYFTEASDQAGNLKDFVGGLLKGQSSMEAEYVRIPGVGRSGDYAGLDVEGKIALVKRGSTTFEDKVRTANRQGAAGIIIYNNVSGKIAMTVGRVDLPACSISQSDGEILAANDSGKLTLALSQVAGPFMSDFSSWGPTPDLKIKPEITAHGGNILSAVPGQHYDRLSGTSMASPNQAGVTALIRQYVKETFPGLSGTQITARVNQIMMSTTDIVINTNGLPYSVRKQGAGLANLSAATTTPAYVSTFDAQGNEMDKTKIELGDDAKKSGVYTLNFAVNNISASSLTYDAGAVVMTEGVSKTLTVRGDTTVTEEGYLLGASVEVKSVKGGTNSGNKITVPAKSSATVQVVITLTDADKEYLDKSFANGMFVEGFVTLKGTDGNEINLNVPYLAFYGDWNVAPIFDLDFYETNPDELNNAIDADEKKMADSYATRPVGGLYEDYITYLGSYYFVQDPSATPIAANRDHIALTNQTGEEGGINSIHGVWAGILKAADRVEVVIENDVTGEVIYEDTQYNQRKSYSTGSNVYLSSIDFDFSLADYDLKNNTRYNVKLKAYTPYGDGGADVNLRNTFEFSFVTDFEAPLLTGCNFYTEYDATAKKTRLFANLSIYDNHYSQAAALGVIGDGDGYISFDKYLNPLYSGFNSTYTLTYELTDRIDDIKKSYNGNSFIIQLMDYAFNVSTFEVSIPDNVTNINSFKDGAGNAIDSLTLSPNEVYVFNLDVVSGGETSWIETLSYESTDENVAGVVNGKIIARNPGTATITAISNSDSSVTKTVNVTVRSSTDAGYVKYDKPVTDSFRLTDYYVNKAYYFISGDDRDLGLEDATVKFKGSNYALSFFPSESITVNYDLKAYFPKDTKVEFASSNSSIVTVDGNGRITAVAEGNASVSIRVLMDGKSTYYSQSIAITVKNPYETSGSWLTKYTGLGGEVIIPQDLGVTEIYSYSFSNYDYVPKDENDEISEEDPYLSKIAPIGENTITKVVIPEGVKVIDSYAFAYLTALEEVVLPSTLTKIQGFAFLGCTKLTKINLENVQFVNMEAFRNCPLEKVNLSSIVAIGTSAFEIDADCVNADGEKVTAALSIVSLPASAQSLGSRAFYNNSSLNEVTFSASSVKLGNSVFANCSSLTSINVNSAVIPSSAFDGCVKLNSVTLGRDVSVIGQYAFAGTAVTRFAVDANNANFKAGQDGTFVTTKDGKTLVLVVPSVRVFNPADGAQITKIGDAALSGNTTLTTVTLASVTDVGKYSFAGCSSLSNLTLGKLTQIGEYAFADCAKLREVPQTDASLSKIGNYAFRGCTGLTGVVIADNVNVGDGAFMYCDGLESVVIGNGVTLGEGAFSSLVTESVEREDDGEDLLEFLNYTSEASLTGLEIGKGVTIGAYAFYGQTKLEEVSLGSGATIGAYAFNLNTSLKSIDLSEAKEIGAYAFSGMLSNVYVCGFYEDGEPYHEYLAGYLFFAPELETLDLSSVEVIGDGAFMFNRDLKTVKLGAGVKEIGGYSFFYCDKLEEINLSKVEYIGGNAFGECSALVSADLVSAKYIGSYAFFYAEGLEEVKLGTDVIIDDKAFGGDEKLADIDLSGVLYIGKSAFAGTAISEANLDGVKVIDDYAFESSALEKVTFGPKLAFIGENPFVDCEITAFTDAYGKTTFTVSDTAFVEDGVLYTVAPNGGYVLVSYPKNKDNIDYVVKSGTVRISGMAFAYNEELVSVELPYELGAIGDKAFYQCNSLTVAVFNSLNAPILEEKYDVDYQEYFNLPLTGYYMHVDELEDRWNEEFGEGWIEEFKGTGLLPFYMWNCAASNYLYGANFINYVGKQTQPLVFVTPSNGTYYDSFLISRYYTKNVYGAVAPYKATLDVIAAIAALPDNITLDDEEAVVAARNAYDGIALLEQQALVTNYVKLTSAENTIEFIKKNDGDTPPEPPEPPAEFNYLPLVITFSVLTGVFLASTATLATLWILDRKKLKNKEADNEKKN